jgi:diaminopimelate decarboxylase
METGMTNRTRMADAMLSEAIAAYGTPLYVYDSEVVRGRLEALRSCLPPGAELYYSLKCNPLIGVAQFLRQQGCRVEVASGGELNAALLAGFAPEQILFTSPGKTIEELRLAVQYGIYSLNVENVDEIAMIDALASEQGRIVDISLRINPDVQEHAAGIRMSGVSSQFGLDESELPAALALVARCKHVRLIGFQVYLGTQILQAEAIVRYVQGTLDLALSYAESYELDLQFIDVGGGFGIPYFSKETKLELSVLRQGLADVWTSCRERLGGIRLAFESGRFLMAESGVFATRVLYKKQSKGSTYLICDGGSHQHASSAFLGRYIRNNFPMRVLGRSGPAEEVHVTGPLCTATDVLGQKVELPMAEPGDVIVIEKSGAYGLTHSPVMFLSHSTPAEVWRDGGEFHLLRERGSWTDYTRGQRSLPEGVVL